MQHTIYERKFVTERIVKVTHSVDAKQPSNSIQERQQRIKIELCLKEKNTTTGSH